MRSRARSASSSLVGPSSHAIAISLSEKVAARACSPSAATAVQDPSGILLINLPESPAAEPSAEAITSASLGDRLVSTMSVSPL